MAIKLVASDLDGTFLTKDNSIPESNLKALEAMKQKQIPFAICTGKSYAISKDICDKCEAQYGIFGNGTQIIDLENGKEIFSNCLSLEDIKICCELANQYGLHIHAYGSNFIITEELKYLDLHNYVLCFHSHGSTFGKYDRNFNLTLTNKQKNNFCFYVVQNIFSYLQENSLPIFNMVLSSNSSVQEAKESLEKLTNLSIQSICKRGDYKDPIINAEYEYISLAPKSVGKGYALNILKDYLKLDTSNVLSIGDNLNDIDLLKNSGVGVAIANAYEPVKEIATYTTKSNASQGGFAEAVYRFTGLE